MATGKVAANFQVHEIIIINSFICVYTGMRWSNNSKNMLRKY
jgi:hypothetical protein